MLNVEEQLKDKVSHSTFGLAVLLILATIWLLLFGIMHKMDKQEERIKAIEEMLKNNGDFFHTVSDNKLNTRGNENGKEKTETVEG